MSSFQLLRHNRAFRYFWAGQSLSEYGSQITLVALPLVAVLSLHASAGEVGLLTAAQRILFPVVGLFAGVLVDRMNRRTVLLVTDLGQAAALSVIPVAYLTGWLSMPVLLAVALVAGGFFVFFEIGYFSYVPNLVPSQDLVVANTALQTTSATALIIGPTAAGLLVAALAPAPTLLFDVGSFLVSFTFMMLIADRAPAGGAAPAPDSRPTMLEDIRAGLRRVYRDPILRGLAEMSAIYLFFYTAFQALVVLFLVDELKMTSTMVGLFFGAFGVGVILGAVVGPMVAKPLGVGAAVVVAAAVGDAAGVVTSLLARHSAAGWTMAAVAAVLMGLGTQITTVNTVSIRQALTPPQFQGRVNGTMRVIAWSVTPLGGLFGAGAGTWFGVRVGLAVAAAGTLLAVVRVCLSPVVGMRALPTSPPPEPSPEVPADALSEPV